MICNKLYGDIRGLTQGGSEQAALLVDELAMFAATRVKYGLDYNPEVVFPFRWRWKKNALWDVEVWRPTQENNFVGDNGSPAYFLAPCPSSLQSSFAPPTRTEASHLSSYPLPARSAAALCSATSSGGRGRSGGFFVR